MKNKKYVHFFLIDKFTVSFVNMIKENFDPEEHLFFLYSFGYQIQRETLASLENIIYLDDYSRLKKYYLILKYAFQAEKIFFHPLYFSSLLSHFPGLLKKSYWVIWGGDLYNKGDKSHEKQKLKLISRIGHIVSYVRGDYDFAQTEYQSSAELVNGFYPYLIDERLLSDFENREKSDISYIQVGNSADSSNHHIEVFQLLKNLDYGKSKIVCPLSYGDEKYREQVIQEGKKMLAEDFLPLEKFMDFKNYVELLNNVDVAIFNHNRQQAMGNILMLLALGKEVYIKKGIASWTVVTDFDLIVKETEALKDKKKLANELTDEEKIQNKQNVINNFSYEKCVDSWKNIFD